jgi:CBS domain-containing protein
LIKKFKKRLKMTKKIPLNDFIVKKLITCHKDELIYDAIKKMEKNNIGTIIVVDKKNSKKINGIFTENDLVKALSKNISVTEKLEEVMSKKLITADYLSSDVKISQLMTENKVKKVVITKNKKLYGIITQTDMIKIMTQQFL